MYQNSLKGLFENFKYIDEIEQVEFATLKNAKISFLMIFSYLHILLYATLF